MEEGFALVFREGGLGFGRHGDVGWFLVWWMGIDWCEGVLEERAWGWNISFRSLKITDERRHPSLL